MPQFSAEDGAAQVRLEELSKKQVRDLLELVSRPRMSSDGHAELAQVLDRAPHGGAADADLLRQLRPTHHHGRMIGEHPHHFAEMVGVGRVRAGHGYTRLRITAEHDLRVVDGLLTGLHEPEASHLDLLTAFLPAETVRASYEQAVQRRYLWHEFGDLNLIV